MILLTGLKISLLKSRRALRKEKALTQIQASDRKQEVVIKERALVVSWRVQATNLSQAAYWRKDEQIDFEITHSNVSNLIKISTHNPLQSKIITVIK